MNACILAIVALLTVPAIGACTSSGPSNSADNGGASAGVAGQRQAGINRRILEIEEQGSCAHISAVDGETSRPLVDSCHGWTLSGCSGMLFAHGRGVRVDSGAIIIPTGSSDAPQLPPEVEPRALAQTAIERERGNAFEYLHLRFAPAQCSGSGMEIEFDGSLIRRGTNGPAEAMRGKFVVNRGGSSSAHLLPPRPE